MSGMHRGMCVCVCVCTRMCARMCVCVTKPFSQALELGLASSLINCAELEVIIAGVNSSIKNDSLV